jgi:hypothetical protein
MARARGLGAEHSRSQQEIADGVSLTVPGLDHRLQIRKMVDCDLLTAGIAFVAAAIPIFLFVRSIFFRRPTRINEGFKEFKKQSDLAVSIFLFLIGGVVIFAVGKLVWAWF